MSTATAEPPNATTGFIESATASFREEMASLESKEPIQETSKATPEISKVAEDSKAAEKPKGDIPDKILGVDGKESKSEPTEDDKLLTEAPVGKIGHQQFQKLQTLSKQRIAAAEERAKTFEAQLKEFQSKATSAPTESEESKTRRAEMEKKLAQYEEQLERVAVERSEKFQAKFTKGEEAIKTRIANTLSDAGADKELVDDLLGSKGKRRFEMLDGLDISDSARSYLASVLSEHDALQTQKSEVLSQSREQAKQWDAEQKRQAEAREAQQRAEEETVFNQKLDDISKKFEPFMEVEGEDAWNATVKERRDMAKKFFNGEVDLPELAEIAIYGLGAKTVHSMFHTLKGKYSEALKTIESLKAAQPETAVSRESKASDDALAKMTPEERRMHSFNEALTNVRNAG